MLTLNFFPATKLFKYICTSVFHKFSECEGNGVCNCEQEDAWKKDAGWLTDKDYLPVTAVSVSDTGDSSEEAKVTLGPLLCSGKKPSTCR